MYTNMIETERLWLRPMTLADADACFVWLSDPEVNRFMTYPLYTSLDDVRGWLNRMQDNPDILLFGIERKSDSLLFGSASLTWKPGESAMNLGYNLRRDCWGQGYATEAARAILDAGLRLGYHEFVACHALENVGSGIVIERCGFLFDHEGSIEKNGGSIVFPARYYRLHLE